MHIVQLTDLYRPIIGGLEKHVATLSVEFIRRGHSVVVVTLQPGDLPDEEIVDGVRVIRIRAWSQNLGRMYSDATRPFHPTAPDPGASAALRRVIQQERPDVVHSNGWLQYSFFPLYHARRGPAHVVTLHDYGLACARKTLLHSGQGGKCPGPRMTRCLPCASEQYGFLKGTAITTTLRASRFLHHRVDRYIAISTAVAEGCQQALPTNRKIVIIPTMVPNNMSTLAQTIIRPEFLPTEDGYLMFAGTLGRYKGVDILLEARHRMRNKLPLVLVGVLHGDLPPITESGVIVANSVPNLQVMASWLHASIAIVPSVWHEPIGQVAIEAMLAGRPVVASDVGGLRDIVQHGSTGLVVPPGDPDALASALDSLLDNSEVQQRMGEAGRIRARQFEADAVVPRVLEVFEEALLSRSSGKLVHAK